MEVPIEYRPYIIQNDTIMSGIENNNNTNCQSNFQGLYSRHYIICDRYVTRKIIKILYFVMTTCSYSLHIALYNYL